jgi:glycosyltransferase involved in cell wall biosynthesis
LRVLTAFWQIYLEMIEQHMGARRGTVLFLSHDATRTGAPIFMLRLLRWFRQTNNINFRTLVGKAGELGRDFETLGTVDSFEPDETLPYRMLRRLQLHRRYVSSHHARLREMLRQSDIRLIYANSIATAKMVDFLSFLDCPVICHVHELNWAIRNLGKDNLAIFERCRAHYIAVSHSVKENLVQHHGIPASKIQVIHGFVPVPEQGVLESCKPWKSLHEAIAISSESKIVCACGSIESRKGIDLFLKVASYVVCRYRAAPVNFVWVGGSAEVVSRMRRYVSKSELRDVVTFVGHKSDVAPYFKASDIFLLTSREDPFPLVMMEAALHCKPIVCFDQSGGAPEFVEDDAGFVIPDFDVGQMGNKVIELLSSPQMCSQMGIAGRLKVVSRHNLEAGAATIASAIEKAMSSTAAVASLRRRSIDPICLQSKS